MQQHYFHRKKKKKKKKKAANRVAARAGHITRSPAISQFFFFLFVSFLFPRLNPFYLLQSNIRSFSLLVNCSVHESGNVSVSLVGEGYKRLITFTHRISSSIAEEKGIFCLVYLWILQRLYDCFLSKIYEFFSWIVYPYSVSMDIL